MSKVKVAIAGASGFAGGDLLRILLGHSQVEIIGVSSETYASKAIARVHPHLRKQSELRFVSFARSSHVRICYFCVCRMERQCKK